MSDEVRVEQLRISSDSCITAQCTADKNKQEASPNMARIGGRYVVNSWHQNWLPGSTVASIEQEAACYRSESHNCMINVWCVMCEGMTSLDAKYTSHLLCCLLAYKGFKGLATIIETIIVVKHCSCERLTCSHLIITDRRRGS